MTTLELPWLELATIAPLLGLFWLLGVRDAETARWRAVVAAAAALGCSLFGWLEFAWLDAPIGQTAARFWSGWGLMPPLALDEFNAPLPSLAALVFLLTVLATMRSKIQRFSFAWALLAHGLLLGTLSCREPWLLIVLLVLGTIPPAIELRSRGRSMRIYLGHMGLFAVCLVGGWWQFQTAPAGSWAYHCGLAAVVAAVMLRSGVAPVHCWMTDLFANATFGTALLFVTPMVGAYAMVRLVLPVAPTEMLRVVSVVSLFTSVYAAGMANVQQEARRFFCYLFLSSASLVLVGLEIATLVGLTGALSLWLAVGLSLSGFGLTLRSIEARTGPLSLAEYHGLYPHTPTLAACFLLTGLASVGFPGTIGFVGASMLVDGAVQVYPYTGLAAVIAAALIGIAVMQAYFRIFTGRRYTTSVPLETRLPERIAVLTLSALILLGGFVPQPGVQSRHRAAHRIIEQRRARFPTVERTPVAGQHAVD